MPEVAGMDGASLLEGLLELADRAEFEVRILSASSAAADNAPRGSAACRVGHRIWVILAPDDPPLHQARVLAGALGRYRAEFLEDHFVAPGIRDFIDRSLA
jgi:hypothetical protein